MTEDLLDRLARALFEEHERHFYGTGRLNVCVCGHEVATLVDWRAHVARAQARVALELLGEGEKSEPVAAET